MLEQRLASHKKALAEALQHFIAGIPYELMQQAKKYHLNKWVYFVKGVLDQHGLNLNASVIASMVYSTSFTLEPSSNRETHRLRHYCNCPQGQNGVLCEHVVALAQELKIALDEDTLEIEYEVQPPAEDPKPTAGASLSQGLKRMKHFQELLSEFEQALYTRPVQYLQDYISLVESRRMSVELSPERDDLKLLFYAEKVGKRGNTLKTSSRRISFSEIVKHHDPVFSSVQKMGYPDNPDAVEGKLVVTDIGAMIELFRHHPRFYWEADRAPVQFGSPVRLHIEPVKIKDQELLKLFFTNPEEGISIPYEWIMMRGLSEANPIPALYGRCPNLGICFDKRIYPLATHLSKERILALVYYLGQIPINHLSARMNAHLFEEILGPLVGRYLYLYGQSLSLVENQAMIDPVAIFQLDLANGNHELRIFFRYGNKEVDWTDQRERIIDHEASIIHLRNWDYEGKVIDLFEQGAHLQMIQGMSPLFLDHQMVMEMLDFLHSHDQPELAGEKMLLRIDEQLRQSIPKKIEVKVTGRSGVNWFEIDVQGRCEGRVLDPAVMKRVLEQRKKYVEVDGRAFKVESSILRDVNRYLDRYRMKSKGDDKDQSVVFQIPWFEQEILDALPATVFQEDQRYEAFQKAFSNQSEIPSYPVPPSFKGTLRPYQLMGYQWLRFLEAYGLHGILADDMGLGKTIQAICLLVSKWEASKEFKALVVAPLSLLDNWAREIRRFAPMLRVEKHHGTKRCVKKLHKPLTHVIVTSYSTLRQDIEEFEKIHWDYLILDEAQFIKNKTTTTFKQIRKVLAKNRLALSGTPIENTPRDIKGIFDFLMPGFLGNDRFFEHHYLKDLPCLQSRIRPFILRRKKDEVLDDLPSKTIENLFVEMPPEQEAIYRERFSSAKLEIESMLADAPNLHKHHWKILTHLIRLRQIACHCGILDPSMASIEYSGKLQALNELLEGICSEGYKVLVFSQFAQMIDLISRHLTRQKMKHLMIHGGVRNRTEIVEQFDQDPEHQILLLTLKVGGLGLNLTQASYVVLFDPWWNPAAEIQAIDRTHRIGQTKPVNVYRLFSSGTIEEKVLLLQEKKLKWASEVLDVQPVTPDMEYIEQLRSLL